ncbi:MAG: tRNA uridine-5-carboxymethylaminomethyl(34) synthesis GTPase MnmE [Sedimentisphaerales bacterium]|nr:tRNA uridine-5-carboxymethylaminomethyl(34) synthesis GTPase MnmE [Sedimentisphaerales bacterium]
MYNVSDTIVAVSSPGSGRRVIIRISGPQAFKATGQIFEEAIPRKGNIIVPGFIIIDKDLKIDAALYVFQAPNSYTGEDIIEIHLDSNQALTEAILGRLLTNGLRPAEPGEFTARAYLHGKIDLTQAEAVNEVITCSARLQLSAAQQLLKGKLATMTDNIRLTLLDVLGAIEVELDFSTEDIELVSPKDSIERLETVKKQLQKLLAGSISYESVIDLPAVGIAGAPNAGKSTLTNKLLGRERSIVAEQPRTTRDVLTGILTLQHCRCVLFDCAGLIPEPKGIIDELAQQAAVEALNNAAIVVFCVDLSKKTADQWTVDINLRELIKPNAVIAVATKSDLVADDLLPRRVEQLNVLFKSGVFAISARTDAGLEGLRQKIDAGLIRFATGKASDSAMPTFTEASSSHVALTARHKSAVTEAIENIEQAIGELEQDNGEIAAMMLRAAIGSVSLIQQQHLDEQILERIFSRFCIGK